MTTYTTKRSQSTQSLYANNVTNVFRNVTKVLILVKTKLPKIFKMNKNAEKYVFSRDVTNAHAHISMY